MIIVKNLEVFDQYFTFEDNGRIYAIATELLKSISYNSKYVYIYVNSLEIRMKIGEYEEIQQRYIRHKRKLNEWVI